MVTSQSAFQEMAFFILLFLNVPVVLSSSKQVSWYCNQLAEVFLKRAQKTMKHSCSVCQLSMATPSI